MFNHPNNFDNINAITKFSLDETTQYQRTTSRSIKFA